MKKKKKILLLLIITLILELFVFNFRFFIVQSSDLKREEINFCEIGEKNFYEIDETESTNDVEEKENRIYQRIEIPLNKPIESVKVNFSRVTDKNIQINAQFTDEGERYTLKNYNTFDYNKNFKNSEYFVLNSQGNCETLYLYLSSDEDFEFKNIEINTWYYEFNILRVATIIGIGLLILYWKEINSYFERHRKVRIAVYVVLILISVIIYGLFCLRHHQTKTRFIQSEAGKVNVDPYNLLTESLLHGRIDLNYPYEGTPIGQEEIEKLASLQNTKDRSERIVEDALHYFDTAFYDGKYYCYYGIVPVLTVMLPIAILTGEIVYSAVPAFVYGSILMIVVLLVYLEILKKLKIKLSFIFEVFLYITLFLATGLPNLMNGPIFYQTADLSGLAWGFVGIYALLKLDNNNKIFFKLFIAGLSFGLMVCSRPIYVLYFVIYVILVFKYIVKDKKIDLKRLLYFSVPIAIIAILQMIYNYARYDSIFEFGQFWQLTINDPSQQKLDIGMALNGIVVYLFNLPRIEPTFPYVSALYIPVQNGNLIYCESVYGIICYPFLWSIVLGWHILKKDKRLKLLWISTIIISILALGINTCLAGMNQRYVVDVQPCIAVMSFVIWMIYLKKYNMDGRAKRLIFYLSIVTCILSSLIMLSRTGGIKEFLGIESQVNNIFHMIKHAVIFYK